MLLTTSFDLGAEVKNEWSCTFAFPCMLLWLGQRQLHFTGDDFEEWLTYQLHFFLKFIFWPQDLFWLNLFVCFLSSSACARVVSHRTILFLPRYFLYAIRRSRLTLGEMPLDQETSYWFRELAWLCTVAIRLAMTQQPNLLCVTSGVSKYSRKLSGFGFVYIHGLDLSFCAFFSVLFYQHF